MESSLFAISISFALYERYQSQKIIGINIVVDTF